MLADTDSFEETSELALPAQIGHVYVQSRRAPLHMPVNLRAGPSLLKQCSNLRMLTTVLGNKEFGFLTETIILCIVNEPSLVGIQLKLVDCFQDVCGRVLIVSWRDGDEVIDQHLVAHCLTMLNVSEKLSLLKFPANDEKQPNAECG